MAAVFALGVMIPGVAAAMPQALSLNSKSAAIPVVAKENAEELEKAEAFITGVADRGIDFLSDQSLSNEEKTQKFEKLLSESFDLKTIGRFTLGRYWRTASEDQRTEFLELFEQSVIDSYSRRFKEYKGEDVTIDGASAKGEGDIVVKSFIVPPGGQKVQVDWRVRKKGGSFAIIDIIVEGVSMALTQRSDFASVIQRGGGDVQVLIDHLKQ